MRFSAVKHLSTTSEKYRSIASSSALETGRGSDSSLMIVQRLASSRFRFERARLELMAELPVPPLADLRDRQLLRRIGCREIESR